MKRNLLIWLGVIAISLIPAWSQQPEAAPPTGKIHGKVTNPVGTPQPGGTISLSKGGQDKATFTVDQNGEYHGEAPEGTYTLLYRNIDTPKTQRVDQIDNVKIVAGQDIEQDDDMSRPEFIKTLPEATQKQLEDLKKHNSEALKANVVIKQLNADIKSSGDLIHDADTATAEAQKELGSGATKQALVDKVNEIRTQKFTQVADMMKKDTVLRPDASILWARLGQAQNGLKQYDDAITSFQKALDIEKTSKKPMVDVQGLAQAGIGEAYARTGKVQEANDAYEAAAKLNPAQAGFYYKNEAIIFFQAGNGDAQVAAADKAIAAAPDDPKSAIVYYLKGQGLVQKASFDAKTQKIVLPPGCEEAYQKYLQLDPNGPYANDVKGILQQADQKIQTTYKAGKKK
jgi:tetratricopeptide (TPR) repeat protein